MAVSFRMYPLLEKELEQAASRRGVSKSQFIIDAVERALGRKNPYELMLSLKAEEAGVGQPVVQAFKGTELPYETDTARAAMFAKLKEKHSDSSAV
ncbi:MAG: hypothetical protein ACYCZ6_10265 [Polaromonas sp.]